ncbi:MAG: sporulation protein [Saprospiraceae bacterium]
MIGTIKKYLGIESIKIDIEIPEEVSIEDKFIKGKINISSMSNQVINSIEIKLIENYQRGRGKTKKINDYVAGQAVFSKTIKVIANNDLSYEFKLPFKIETSEMDKIGDQNFFTRILVKSAKLMHNVKSEYRIEAKANVKGNAVYPFVQKSIKIV